VSSRALLLAGLLLLHAPTLGAAQDACSADQGRYHLRPAPEVLVVPAPTPVDLDAGEVDAGTLSVSIIPRGNGSRDWRLCIRAVRPTMGPGGKDVSDIEVRAAPGETWTPATTFDRVIARGRGRSDVAIHVRVRVDWSDEPGWYDSLLALTLVAD
jgi:hypothetical protein